MLFSTVNRFMDFMSILHFSLSKDFKSTVNSNWDTVLTLSMWTIGSTFLIKIYALSFQLSGLTTVCTVSNSVFVRIFSNSSNHFKSPRKSLQPWIHFGFTFGSRNCSLQVTCEFSIFATFRVFFPFGGEFSSLVASFSNSWIFGYADFVSFTVKIFTQYC